MGSSVGTCARCVHVFFSAFGAPTLNAQSVLSNENFWRRSSGGSLLRLQCWLGSGASQKSGRTEEEGLPPPPKKNQFVEKGKV